MLFAHRRAPRRAFTLVELLVVIVIIAILASLITVAAIGAISQARETRVKAEIESLAEACYAFKAKYGAFPPSNAADATAFWARAFPYATATAPAVTNDTALVVWLSGFSPDRTNPMSATGKTPFFQFKADRIQGQTYVPDHPDMTKCYRYIDVSRGIPSGTGMYKNVAGAPAGDGSFQIICAGVDNDYGAGGTYPTGIAGADLDNITNFSKGRLENDK